MLSLLATLAVAVQAAGAAPPHELRREELMSALRSGGYTILVRHGRTLKLPDSKETPGYTPAARSEQRNLSDDGVKDVRRMGEVFRKYAIPVGEVIASPLYRTMETAEAFGTPTPNMVLRTYPTTAETQALVAAAPKPGTNRVLVTHHFVIEQHVPGINPGDIAESEAAVVRATGDGKVTLVGRISLGDWEALAGPSVAASAAAMPAAPATTVAYPAHGAQTGPALPETRAGRLAARYIEAFNSGDTTRMRAYIEKSLTDAPDRPMEARLKTYAQLFAQHGPLSVIGVASSQPDSLVLEARTRDADVTMTVRAAPAPSDRIQSVTFAIKSTSTGHP
jgi:phosphohistidine phosphatase SixA